MSDSKIAAAGDERLVLTLVEVVAMVERRLDLALSHCRGISFSEYRLLRSLALLGNGPVMRIELAEAVGLTASAVTRALGPLEKLGYVRTQKSDRDARRSLVSLTAGGTKLLADAQAAVADVIADLPLAPLHLAELDAFRTALLGTRIMPVRDGAARG